MRGKLELNIATNFRLFGSVTLFGLAVATKHVPAIGRKETSACRLGGDSQLTPN
jgi:hypothetical protein